MLLSTFLLHVKQFVLNVIQTSSESFNKLKIQRVVFSNTGGPAVSVLKSKKNMKLLRKKCVWAALTAAHTGTHS